MWDTRHCLVLLGFLKALSHLKGFWAFFFSPFPPRQDGSAANCIKEIKHDTFPCPQINNLCVHVCVYACVYIHTHICMYTYTIYSYKSIHLYKNRARRSLRRSSSPSLCPKTGSVWCVRLLPVGIMCSPWSHGATSSDNLSPRPTSSRC